VGGKHLTNVLKEFISYRHWNMMDEFSIVNQVKEALCFLPEDGKMEPLLRYAKTRPLGSRWFDRNFVLPDFVHSFKGTVQLSKAWMSVDKSVEDEDDKNEEEKEEPVKDSKDAVHPNKRPKMVQDAPIDENTMNDKRKKLKRTKEDSDNDDNEDDDDELDSEDESDEAKRSRILQRKEEEKRLFQLQQEEHQILPMSVERFTVPEILFRPSDIGMNQLGIAEAIVQSIQACDPIYHAAMYHNIVLTGGNMLIPNFKQRLEVELRALVPSQYTVRVYLPEDPVSYAWDGAREWVSSGNMSDYACLNRKTWEGMKTLQRDWGSIWKKANAKDYPDHGYILI